MRACRSSSRSEGIGSSSPGASVPPLRWSAVASSSAKKGLPPRGLPESDQRRPRERRVEAGAQQLVGRAEAQAADVDRSQSLLAHGAAKPGRHVAADRQQGGDRLTFQAGERVPKRRERRRVQPLDVVDREADGTVAGEQPQRTEEGGGDGAVIGCISDSPSSKAPSSARRWIGGSSGKTSPAALPRRSVSPANENWVSASEGRADRIR